MEGLLDRTELAATRRQRQSVWSPEGEDLPDVERRRVVDTGRSQWPTRTLNFVLALLALVSLLPVMLVIAVLVKLTSRGPVLYTQERVGQDRRQRGGAALNHRRSRDSGGRPFTMYKFRTMRVDAEQHSGAVWAQERDPRVTAIGSMLRQYRLDELPQLVNVLRG